MRLDDFVCLGRTVPEESRKYGHKVCMAGYSPELRSLLRVYPLPVINPIRTRRTCVLEVERNPQDSRLESWKLRDRESSIVAVSDHEIPTADVTRFLRDHLAASIDELNDRRASLGVLEAGPDCRGTFVSRSNLSHPDQGWLFENLDHAFGAGAIDIAPYLEFSDSAGRPHRLQLREWGCYEWLRRNRHEATQLWDNLHLGDDATTLLVVGNMSNRRNVWLIIKTFKVAVSKPMPLFA